MTRGQADWIVVIVALFGGGIGVLLAILAQKMAAGVAGFLIGGYLATWLLQLLGFELSPWAWVWFIVGGIIGLILVLSLLESALIVLTSIIGAALIVAVLNLDAAFTSVLFLALLAIGMIIQTRILSEKS